MPVADLPNTALVGVAEHDPADDGAEPEPST